MLEFVALTFEDYSHIFLCFDEEPIRNVSDIKLDFINEFIKFM